jgi:hypothetical protein
VTSESERMSGHPRGTGGAEKGSVAEAGREGERQAGEGETSPPGPLSMNEEGVFKRLLLFVFPRGLLAVKRFRRNISALNTPSP